ncbi:MAG: response regulator transcription factor [Halioglobus sp.]
MISVLSIDSDVQFSTLLSIYLQSEGGFVLTTAEEGRTGCELLADEGFDIILLDSKLEGISGFEVLRAIRRSGDDTPVVMFTARGDNLERYHAIQDEADIYLPKSCRLGELADCIRRLHEDHEEPDDSGAGSTAPVKDAPLRLDDAHQSARFSGHTVPLSAEEYRVLAALAERRGQAVSREALLDAACAAGAPATVRLVDNCIGSLRRKLGPDDQGHQLIRAVGELGFTLRL